MQNANSIAEPLFSFAVIADSHINEGEDNCNSPFAVNRLSNRRLRSVIDNLNRREIKAVFHLGDVVHPVPSMGAMYTDSANCFYREMNRLNHPYHIIPGNHDVGDKPIDWGPAGTVRDDFLEAWSNVFGRHYFHETIEALHFLGINAQLLGSGLGMEVEQRQWMEKKLAQLKGKRICILTHYPPFLAEIEESEHYDNLGELGRGWLLGLIKQYRVEALFAGHVHHFWYNRYAECDCYLLPSTAFTRQDYSEMFHVLPAAEYGRNDPPKLGYLLVHVYEDRHDIEMVRCYGMERGIDETHNEQVAQAVVPINPRNNIQPLLGFDLRQDWMEQVQIPPSGGLDEFDRKWVRNDYPLLALLEMGARNLRVPASDLLNEARRSRIEDLVHLGFEFTFYSWGLPSISATDIIKAHATLIYAWEFSWSPAQAAKLETGFLDWLSDQQKIIIYSPLRSKQDIMDSGKTYYHVINHGLTVPDLNDENKMSGLDCFKSMGVSSLLVRVGIDDQLPETMLKLKHLSEQTGNRYFVHLRLSGDNPAEATFDDHMLCNRIAQAIFFAWTCPGIAVTADTLADNDRGYFPRNGVIDRLCNPKPGFQVVRSLHAELSRLGQGTTPSTSSLSKCIVEHTSTIMKSTVKLLLPELGCTEDKFHTAIREASSDDQYERIVATAEGFSYPIDSVETVQQEYLKPQPLLLI